MFRVLEFEEICQQHVLRASMLAHRTDQFVARHRWPLETDRFGVEVDEYDAPGTQYCVVERYGHHLASLRLRPARAQSMTETAFHELWDAADGKIQGSTEVSRLCYAPGLTAMEQFDALSDLALGLCRHCSAAGVTSIFGVVFPAVLKLMKRIAWPPNVLGQCQSPTGPLLLVEWQASEFMVWELQERRAEREAMIAARAARRDDHALAQAA